jgi:hypothetical protein
VKLGGPHDGDDKSRAMHLALERELQERALEEFPEIQKLGTFGDPAFDEALDRAMCLIDGDGGKSTAEVDLEHDIVLMELNGGPTDAEEMPGDVTAPRDGGSQSCGGRR